MAKPTRTDVRAVDPVLTNMLIAYMNGDERYISLRACPSLSVDSSEGTYFLFEKKYWFDDAAQLRAWGADYQEGGFDMTTATYLTEQFAKKFPMPEEVQADSQVPLSLEETGIKWLRDKMMLRNEREFASTFFTTSVWATDATGGSTSTKWSTYATSDPVADVRTAKRTISQSTAQTPNLFMMGEIVEDKLLNHPDLIDRIKYTDRATVATMREALAAVLGVDEVVVGEAIYNTANVGQTASLSPIIDDDALLVYKNASPTPQKFEPSAFYNFFWEPGGGLGQIKEIYWDPNKDSDVIKAKMQIDYKVVASDCGYFFSDYVD